MPIGYSAILLPQLAEENGTMYADRQLGSWIGTSICFKINFSITFDNARSRNILNLYILRIKTMNLPCLFDRL